jgi:hypothetical protein
MKLLKRIANHPLFPFLAGMVLFWALTWVAYLLLPVPTRC